MFSKNENNLVYLDSPDNLKDILTEEFMRNYTRFNSLKDMLSDARLQFEKIDDFLKLPKIVRDNFIYQTTIFRDWTEMIQKAVN